MDESWRMRMGMDPLFSISRKSVDQIRSAAVRDVDDFADVFGGPPRSVFTRKLSGDFTRTNYFYDEIFQPQEFRSRPLPVSKSHGRSLQAFRIPAGGDGFYGDVFGIGGGGGRTTRERSQTISRSTSCSVFTSEEMSPHRPAATSVSGDDVALSSFASRLRPLNVPSRSRREQQRREGQKKEIPAFNKTGDSFSGHDNTPEANDFYHHGFSQRASPETISLDPNSFRSFKMSMEDLGPSSPASSPVSTVCEITESKERTSGCKLNKDEDEDDEEDEVMSSYVIEINSNYYDRNNEGGASESIDLDEAIAWAKERFLRPDTKLETECHSHEDNTVNSTLESSSTEEDDTNSRRIKEDEMEMEMEKKDKEIKIWLTGKETNIRLLLSTLHHVLWPKSGWNTIYLSNLRDGSQLKKAYQKARLCLHPDKLQQRGASPWQKYVAEKVFSILQDAWAAYVTGEGFSS